jgi:uncharacterized membrane protein YcaP (DUF421 family)
MSIIVGIVAGWDFETAIVPSRQAFSRADISDEELRAMLHEHEVDDIAQVRRAWLEPDGRLTVLRRRASRDAGRS